MDNIDYEALAKAAYASYMGQRYPSGIRPDWEGTQVSQREIFQTEARAVVAALREQGFVVASVWDIERAMEWYAWVASEGDLGDEDIEACDRLSTTLNAALAATGDGETP